MINIKSPLCFMAVFVLMAIASLLFPTVQAQGQGTCLVQIIKEAIPSDETAFNFTCTGGVDGDCAGAPEFPLRDGQGVLIVISVDDTATVVEDVPEGWELDDISCETDTPNNITFDFNAAPNGVFITCLEQQMIVATCTFRNLKQCEITIEKNTLVDLGTQFDFTAPGSSDPDFALQNDQDIELFIANGENVDVTEMVPDKWILEAIECSLPDGVVITEIPDGRNFACSNPDGTADCVFINRPLRNIPTLSEWGLIAMAGILGIVGFMVMRRRKLTA